MPDSAHESIRPTSLSVTPMFCRPLSHSPTRAYSTSAASLASSAPARPSWCASSRRSVRCIPHTFAFHSFLRSPVGWFFPPPAVRLVFSLPLPLHPRLTPSLDTAVSPSLHPQSPRVHTKRARRQVFDLRNDAIKLFYGPKVHNGAPV